MRALAIGALVVVPFLAACGGASQRPAMTAIADMERARTGPGAKEGAELAPQAYALAEQERVLAKKAYDDGDDTGAALHADRALAAYGHALVLARAARAAKDLADAKQTLDGTNEQLQKLAASRAQVDAEADALEKQVQVAREMLLPAPTGPADPGREEARRVAARTLALQARLLCGAAKLLAPELAGLADADTDITAAEKQIEVKAPAKGSVAAIDLAARARATCLSLLSKARRTADASSSSGQADALLDELSKAGGWDPSRDERGVVVTLREAFTGSSLTPDAEKKIRALGQVAAAHTGVAVQIVVHDAAAPSAADLANDEKRADAAAKALVAGGATAAKVKWETAGAKAPVADPTDAKSRARNARVEIVFVTPGT
jgi:flagellar motor protein MotB